jgi:hypothetical protein
VVAGTEPSQKKAVLAKKTAVELNQVGGKEIALKRSKQEEESGQIRRLICLARHRRDQLRS